MTQELPDTDDGIVKAATKKALEVMLHEGDYDRQLRAATTLLNFYKAKPQAKQEISIAAAEDWIEKLEKAKGKPIIDVTETVTVKAERND